MAEQNNEQTTTPIAEFVVRENYPECVRGQSVDIGGFTGIVMDIVNNSLKVRSPEGVTRSFNYNTLIRLYGPRVEIAPPPPFIAPVKEPEKPVAPPEPEEIQELNFDREPKVVNDFTAQTDFPKCVLGELLDIGGYIGIVVSVFGESLKVRSQEGTSRKYNAQILRKIYGKK